MARPTSRTIEVTMREPAIVRPEDIGQVPDRPAVFLLWAAEGKPYLARTSLLRRRLKRLLSDRDRTSRLLNLRGVAERIEYWATGSQLAAWLIHLELAQRYFPEDWPRLTRLRPPAFLRLTLDHPFPRTMITTRLGRGLFYGPFAGRATAERFEAGLLDLFQIRRCEENLAPTPAHPGCIYGEMNRCLRPCQQAVSIEEYRSEAARVAQFLSSGGASLKESAEAARDRASAEMQFEEAERQHQRVTRIGEVQALSGELARSLDRLNGVAVAPSAEAESVELWLLTAGRWQEPRVVSLSEAAGVGMSLDHRLRDIISGATPAGEPDLEHLSILLRWHGSSWRDGEWIGFDSPAKVPYRKLVNAISRVAASARAVYSGAPR
jgi:excinuclease ABC subunit C